MVKLMRVALDEDIDRTGHIVRGLLPAVMWCLGETFALFLFCIDSVLNFSVHDRRRS
jgi:hypothetical protein